MFEICINKQEKFLGDGGKCAKGGAGAGGQGANGVVTLQ